MSVLSREDYFARLHARLAEDQSDEGIAFLEDMTDTYMDMENRINGAGVDWEKKYKDLDESWRKKYRHRFLTGSDMNIPKDPEGEPGKNPEDITIEDLFK